MPDAPPTAYPSTELKPQDATPGKGLDSKMEPSANWTQLEVMLPHGSIPPPRCYIALFINTLFLLFRLRCSNTTSLREI